MQKEAFQKACLTATVAVAWAGSSSPAIADTPGNKDPVYIRTSTAHSLAAARFVGIRDLTWIIVDLGAMDAGTQDRTVSTGLGSGGGGGGGGLLWYTILGTPLGTGSGGGDVFAGFGDASGALGQTFETVFPGFNEAQVADAILTGGPLLDSFVASIVGRPPTQVPFGVSSPVLGFSAGSQVGTVIADFTPIPEPGAAIVCLGAIGIGMLRRRCA